MKGLIVGMIFGGILVFLLLAYIGVLTTNQTITGNAVNIPAAPTEQVIIDNQQYIEKNMQYFQTFEVFQVTKVYVDIASDNFVNYALLPDYEVEHYRKGESYRSYANLESVLSMQDTYNLNPGKYSVVITSLDNPVEIHIIVKGQAT
jgi:hypothetical protein